ncbi:MAG: nuclear transport factor 2 family protein [Cyclobacteriaceae bacterium]|nr:nuclear transport factor 2 family protein [Cyclobacteriaceae bacterium]
MKQHVVFSVIVFFLWVWAGCVPMETETTEADRTAIVQVIQEESRAFYAKDHARWSRTYVHSHEVHWVCVEPDVTLRAKGWEDLSQFVSAWMAENPEPWDYDKAEFNDRNVHVRVMGNMAFVSMESSNRQPDGTIRQTVGSRTLQKEGNSWKILSMTSYPNDSPRGSTANVYVHHGPASASE